MVEFGNSLDHPDEEFDDLLGILDFPIDDCLEEGEIVEDWDISSAQCLGPIPYDMLMEPPMISNEELDSPNLFPRPVAPIAGAPEQKQLLEHVHAQSQASVLESSGGKSLSIKSDNAIPVRRRSKRVRHSGINPRLLAAHELSTSKQTSNASSSSKESRKSLIQQPVAMDLMRISPNYVDNSLNVSDHARQTASEPCPEVVKKCAHCQSTKTPQWREGPLGPLTLCNACGVRYRSGRLFPEYGRAASPTFVSSQHSNSHKKVVAMRHEANLLKFKIKIPRVPEGEQLGKHAIADTSSSRPIAGTPKHVDTTCLLVPRLIPTPRVPEQKQVAKHVQIAGVPERKQVAEHVDNSSSRIRPQIAGTPKHVDSPCSLVPRLIAGVPEQKQPAKPVQIAGVNEQKHLGKHVDTSCSLIPPRAHSGKSREQKHHVERMQLAKRKLLADYADGTSQNKLAKTKVQQESRAPLLESSLKYDLRRAGGKPPLSPCRKVRIMNMKKCAHCQSTRTPKWREGPLGPGTLCNACGVRYQSGRLLPQHRPEDSPTLVQMTTKHVKVPPPLLIFE